MAATPTPQAPWSHRVNEDDHGALIAITASLMLVAMTLFIGIRMSIRWPWMQLLGWDDAVAIVSSLIAMAQSISCFEAIRYGLGRHLKDLIPYDLDAMEKSLYASDILLVASLALSKLSVALLVLRLAAFKQHIAAARILAGFIIFWGVASILVIAIRPPMMYPWKLQRWSNVEHVYGWIAVMATSILLELFIITSPIYLVWNLQMARASKIAIVLGFMFRIPVCVIQILHIVSLRNALLGESQDYPWTLIVPSIYAQVEVHYSIIAATVPCMRLFLKSFTTGYLGITVDQVDPTGSMVNTAAATKGSNSYAMGSSGASRQHTRDGTGRDKRTQSGSGVYT